MAKAEPLDEIQWKSPEWIQQFGLHSENVLDYFSESPFYDRTSNNQVLKMQFQFQQVPPNVHPQEYLRQKLVEMVGVEFIIAYVKEPDFWIVRKQKRLSPSNVAVQQDYYIVGANIYQAPKIYDILSSRLLSSINSVKLSLDVLNKISNYNIGNGGHSYPTVNDKLAALPSSSITSSQMEESATTSTTATGANTATPMVSTSGTVVPPGSVAPPGTVGANNINTTTSHPLQNANNALNNILSTTFDGLLSTVINLNDQGTYLDDIPYYGKGSTVEKFDLKINLEDD